MEEKKKKDVLDKFLNWLDFAPSKYFAGLKLREGLAVVEIFHTSRETGIINLGEKKIADVVVYPIGRVHSSGVPWIKEGDFVRLRDIHCMTIENPEYELWRNNSFSNSNATQVGASPPKNINNVFSSYRNGIISPSPLDNYRKEGNPFIFVLEDNYILGVEEDPKVFLI